MPDQSNKRTFIIPTDPAEIAKLLRSVAGDQGPDIAHLPSGTVVEHGVTMQYSLSPGQLTLTILKKPWLFSDGMIFDRIQSYLPPPPPTK